MLVYWFEIIEDKGHYSYLAKYKILDLDQTPILHNQILLQKNYLHLDMYINNICDNLQDKEAFVHHAHNYFQVQ